jgi:NTE family protein
MGSTPPGASRTVWVLGGGGVAGIAWEVGILTGLADEGVVPQADATIIGTSAGAVVGAQIASGIPIDELYERQRVGVPFETASGLRLSELLRLSRASLFTRSPERAARNIGRLSLASHFDDAVAFRQVIEARLPKRDWSATDLRIVAVDTESGERREFVHEDGVPLVDAVQASCAVPMSAPPVQIDGRRYMDGGMRSTLNLDLAPGAGPVIGLAPSTAAIGPWARISTQRAALGAKRRVEVLFRDAESRKAQGRDVMDGSVVPVLVAAAREQGRREASRIAEAIADRSG